jgi:hypothetical protein
MKDLHSLRDIQKDEYNKEPVYYCKHCLSLNIRGVSEMDLDYCDDCGSTEIDNCLIEDWNNKYRERFGHNYLDKY